MAEPGPYRPAGETPRAPIGVGDLAALREQLTEQRRLIRSRLSTLRDTNRQVGRGVAEFRHSGDLLWLRALPGPRPIHHPTDPTSPIDEAEALLRRILGSGPVRTVEVVREARLAGISVRTLARARSRVGVRATRVGGAADRGVWYCRLPETPAV